MKGSDLAVGDGCVRVERFGCAGGSATVTSAWSTPGGNVDGTVAATGTLTLG